MTRWQHDFLGVAASTRGDGLMAWRHKRIASDMMLADLFVDVMKDIYGRFADLEQK